MRIAYIFTTFPKLSERFFLREVLELQRQGLELDIYSMIGGAAIPHAGPVTRMSFVDWIYCCVELIFWMFRAPLVTLKLISRCNPFLYRSCINWGENVLGVAFSIRFARHFRKQGYTYSHGTWATAPGMSVLCLQQLIGLQYTLEAHAYDVFRDGGDALLDDKLVAARALRSSTQATSNELQRRIQEMGSSLKVTCVRRSLDRIPVYQAINYEAGAKLRVLSVGRLIEKKGYFDALAIFAVWRTMGVSFEAKIVGEGELRRKLEQHICDLKLTGHVQLVGKLEYSEVDTLYQQSDLFLFCGKVSASGDRDGFPNVIGEAMSYGLPVFTTDVSATTEVVKSGHSGYIISTANVSDAAAQIYLRMQHQPAIMQITQNAHAWICEEFTATGNVRKLAAALWLPTPSETTREHV